METGENNNSDSNFEAATANEDAESKATTSSSTSPKRYKLDPNTPSTSNQTECNANKISDTVEKNATATDPAESKKTDDEDKNKSPTGRFAKRNYRKRSESQSSADSSVAMDETVPEQSNKTESNANGNGHEETPDPPIISDEAMLSLLDSPYDSDSDDDDCPDLEGDDDDESSSSDSSNSAENEQKVQTLLNKPRPKCDLNLVRNLIYRQSGIMFVNKGERRIYDSFANRITNRISSSVYIVERMKSLSKLERHHGCVNCLNFNKAGNLLVSGSDDLKVIVWNWAKRQPIIIQTSGHRSNVFQSKFVDNGVATNQTDFNLITSARDGEVRLIQVAADGSAKDRLITRHTHYAVHKIAIPDSNPNEVLTAGEDGCVVRSDLRDNKSSEKLVQLRVDGDEVPLYSVAHHPFDPEFCICGRDKFVRVYDKRNVKDCSKLFCPDNILKQKKSSSHINITCALYNYNGTEILASYGDENIYLFDAAVSTPGAYKHMYYGHKNRQTIKGVNFFGPCSEFIMSGSDCGNFFIWDKNSEAIVQWLPGDENGVVNCLESHPHFPIIATSGLDHDIKIWGPMKEHPDGRPNGNDLKKCIKENLNNASENFVQTYMRSIARLVNGGFHRSERSSSDIDSSDSDDEDDGLRTFYRPDRGPCEVQ